MVGGRKVGTIVQILSMKVAGDQKAPGLVPPEAKLSLNIHSEQADRQKRAESLLLTR
jgi:hypothetical protein